MYKCSHCQVAVKQKYKLKNQLRMSQFAARSQPLCVRYMEAHKESCSPKLCNILTVPFYKKYVIDQNKIRDVGYTEDFDLAEEISAIPSILEDSFPSHQLLSEVSLQLPGQNTLDNMFNDSAPFEFVSEDVELPVISDHCLEVNFEPNEMIMSTEINPSQPLAAISDKAFRQDVNPSDVIAIVDNENVQSGSVQKKKNLLNLDVKCINILAANEINEDIDCGTAYFLPENTLKPKISRKKYSWGTNQPGKKGLSSYKCKGVSQKCINCNSSFYDKSGVCKHCKSELKEVQCKAAKYIFVCEGKCSRKIWNNLCCQTKESKLVILYPTPHTCCYQSSFKIVESENDLLANLDIYNTSQANKYDIVKTERLPFDIDGNKIYLLSKTDKYDIDDLVKDGRRYKKYVKTTNFTFNDIFVKRMESKVRLYKCRGTMYCFNVGCPFRLRFDAVNQVQFDVKSNGDKCCVSCGEIMVSIDCNARKYVVIDDHFVLVKHEGTHECPPRSIFETNIVMEIEQYFAINGLSTPFEAVVNHLNRKLDFSNSEKDIQDLIKISLKKWTMKNVKAKVKRSQNPYGPTIQVNIF